MSDKALDLIAFLEKHNTVNTSVKRALANAIVSNLIEKDKTTVNKVIDYVFTKPEADAVEVADMPLMSVEEIDMSKYDDKETGDEQDNT